MSFSPPRKCRIFALASKGMMTVFWDAERNVLTDYLEYGSTFTETYYVDLMETAQVALKERNES